MHSITRSNQKFLKEKSLNRARNQNRFCRSYNLQRTLFYELALFLLFFVASSAGQEKCRTDPSVVGFTSLSKLGEAMRNDFSAIVAGVHTPGPFIYRLCPRVTFELDEFKTGKLSYIYPLLDGTKIVCGSAGRSSDRCIIQGGDAQVILRESMTEGYSRLETEFHGITFQGSDGLSIAAWDEPETKVTFKDCHWKKNTGQAILQNIHVPYDGSSFSTGDGNEKYEYAVQSHSSNRKLEKQRSIKRRLMEDSGLDYVLPTGNLLSKWKEDILQRESRTRNLQIGRAMEVVLIQCSITDAFLKDDDFFLFVNNGGSISMINSQIGRNEVSCNFISVGGTISMRDNHFYHNDASYTIAMLGGLLHTERCVFEKNSVHSEIITQAKNSDGTDGTDFSLNNSCFLQGDYTFSQVFLHPSTMITSEKSNFAKSDTAGLCNTFFEDEMSSCIDDETETCTGTCKNFENKGTCGLSTVIPTAAPTISSAPSHSISGLSMIDDADKAGDSETHIGTIINGVQNAETAPNQNGVTFGTSEIIICTLFGTFVVILSITFYNYRKVDREPNFIERRFSLSRRSSSKLVC